MKVKTKNYALIHFPNKKPIKKQYDTASKAFYDYEESGCILAELFNQSGVLVSSMKKTTT